MLNLRTETKCFGNAYVDFSLTNIVIHLSFKHAKSGLSQYVVEMESN